MSQSIVRCRFAPSPTGRLHVGSVRTLLFNYLFAKKNNGTLILRIEDTDKKRSTKEFEESILKDIKWLGLDCGEGIGLDGNSVGDFGPYRQSEREDIYNEQAEKLISQGKAYYCECSEQRLKELKESQIKSKTPPRYDGKCKGKDISPDKEGTTLRFNFVDSKSVEFIDGIHGTLFFDNEKQAGDFIIIGSDKVAGYNFAAAVDDGLMEVSHVIRGDDHLSNTVRQIAVINALGLNTPSYYHMPLVLGEDKKPLSKRHGHATIEDLKKDGYMAEPILNSLAMLGYNFDGKGYLSLDEMVSAFNEANFSKSASVFDVSHLKGFNKEVFKDCHLQDLYGVVADEFKGIDSGVIEKIIYNVKADGFDKESLVELINPFVSQSVDSDLSEFTDDEADISAMLKSLSSEVTALATESEDSYKEIISKVKESTNLKGKKLFMPIRLVLSGVPGGIELNRLMMLLGKEKIIKRIEIYLEGN